mmetsp:Transcript_5717/g.7037  ORF Transcript_5717/g.7037 Transcript_5717/m.7037 type:complete len:226 (+) Transcript_5717:124-801(+)|eukprot:CAMPEP_0203642624 /NCGR_PEP_ID=MMETSP0088-20131115/8008_1 /ASSEMBLY_ACC=CAM_ASM_001087 /TAXON_ID=426623 /ORGANISM="Chaetoceros affinis, Strain CCMP159" /LENGTH=225 /DNA_ID=CAMNT_0050498509 /DNA_START=18 /DNA_END=695 /DNA_ORIENTATION=+
MLVSKTILVLALVALVVPRALSSCDDSTTFTFGSYQYNAERTTRDCAWIKANEDSVEQRQERWCTYDYEGTIVQDECPLACNVCAPSAMPSISSSPTDPPTLEPSISPSGTPSSQPTLPCVDSLLRLRIPTAGTKPKAQISRYCSWVANRDTKNRCALPGISAACPATCDTCNTCEDPDELRFRFKYNGSKILRNCEFIGRIKAKVPGRCKRSGNICRSTCGYCN